MEDIKLIEHIINNLDKEESELVENWIHKSDENKRYFDELKKLWIESNSIEDFDKIDVNANYQSFLSKIKSIDKKKVARKSWIRTPLKIAASIVFLISISLIYKSTLNTKTEFIALVGTENKYNLSDGSVVWLNKGSKLTINDHFNDKERSVTLEGEGYFEVAKNPNKPFIVESNKTQTKVLGTAFNIKQSKSNVELILQEGSVQFSTKAEQDVLIPGDKIIANSKGDLVKTKNTDLNFLSWKTEMLLFNNTSIKTVIKDIEKLYRVTIDVEDKSFLECSLTTTFDNESLDDVLETLKVLFEIEYSKASGNRYVIIKGSC